MDLDPSNESELAIMDKNLKAMSDKIENYIYVDKFADSQINMLKEEKAHLDRQIKQYEGLKDRLRYVSRQVLDALGINKIKSENGHQILIRHNKSAYVYDINQLPDWAVETVIEKKPNKTKIKDALIAGQQVDGASLKETESVCFK